MRLSASVRIGMINLETVPQRVAQRRSNTIGKDVVVPHNVDGIPRPRQSSKIRVGREDEGEGGRKGQRSGSPISSYEGMPAVVENSRHRGVCRQTVGWMSRRTEEFFGEKRPKGRGKCTAIYKGEGMPEAA